MFGDPRTLGFGRSSTLKSVMLSRGGPARCYRQGTTTTCVHVDQAVLPEYLEYSLWTQGDKRPDVPVYTDDKVLLLLIEVCSQD